MTTGVPSPRSRSRRVLPLLLLASVLIALWAGRGLVVARFAFHPMRDGAEPQVAGGLRVWPLELVTSDSEHLACWCCGPADATRAVLYLHGNAETAAQALPTARAQRFLSDGESR